MEEDVIDYLETYITGSKLPLAVIGPVGCGKLYSTNKILADFGIPHINISIAGMPILDFVKKVEQNKNCTIVVETDKHMNSNQKEDNQNVFKAMMDYSIPERMVCAITKDENILFNFTGRLIIISLENELHDSVLSRCLVTKF